MGRGYSQSELEDIQSRWKLVFPPDLIEHLLQRRPLLTGPGSIDWLKTDKAAIQKALDWPFDGFLFDVENNALWWPEWGERPDDSGNRRVRLAEVFAKAPRLIPLYGHRYLPSEPRKSGNPIFSIHQSDVIYYGENLKDWFEREKSPLPKSDEYYSSKSYREISFWSEAVRRNE